MTAILVEICFRTADTGPVALFRLNRAVKTPTVPDVSFEMDP